MMPMLLTVSQPLRITCKKADISRTIERKQMESTSLRRTKQYKLHKNSLAHPPHTHTQPPMSYWRKYIFQNSDGQWEVLSIGDPNKNLGLMRMAEHSRLKQTRMKQPEWLCRPIYGSAATIKTCFADWLDRLPMPTTPSLFPGYWPICLPGLKFIKTCGKHSSANGKNKAQKLQQSN